MGRWEDNKHGLQSQFLAEQDSRRGYWLQAIFESSTIDVLTMNVRSAKRSSAISPETWHDLDRAIAMRVEALRAEEGGADAEEIASALAKLERDIAEDDRAYVLGLGRWSPRHGT